jgi:CMP-N-acetylneuraminic acid synthetase
MNLVSNVALVPLRGGSKGIPGKNIKLLNGLPLCEYVIRSALSAKHIDQVIVSTDCDKICKVVKEISSEIIISRRGDDISNDHATTESVMLDILARFNFNTLVTIQATSPFLKAEELDKAIDMFYQGGYDSMLSAVRFKRFLWSNYNKPLNYNYSKRPRRQDQEGLLLENGAFYITRREILEYTKCRLGGLIGIFEMNALSEYEIDNPHDWIIVEELMKNYSHENK